MSFGSFLRGLGAPPTVDSCADALKIGLPCPKVTAPPTKGDKGGGWMNNIADQTAKAVADAKARADVVATEAKANAVGLDLTTGQGTDLTLPGDGGTPSTETGLTTDLAPASGLTFGLTKNQLVLAGGGAALLLLGIVVLATRK